MRKSTLFISTALTMFMLVMMFGVVSAYQQVVKNNTVAAPATAEPMVQQVAVAEFVPALPAVISPEQAATIAVEFLGDTNVYSVEVMDYEGVPAFLVTFSSGKLVYVDQTGQILAISEIQPVVVASRNNNGGNSNNSGGGEQEDHDDDHEEHDDD